MIVFDAARLFRSRPPAWHNPLATREGCPGVGFRWMEVEGPINDHWTPAGHKALFGDLPIKPGPGPGGLVEVVSKQPREDAERLPRAFIRRAYRRPTSAEEVRFLPVVNEALASGNSFADALRAGYYPGIKHPHGFRKAPYSEPRPILPSPLVREGRMSPAAWR